MYKRLIGWDIGIFVALCLRFDRHMSWNRNPTGEFRSTAFPKPYFKSCLVAYILGLATTMAVMHVFHAAQPALLYLSPACILSTLITAAIRGELKDLFAYTTEEEEEEKDKDAKEKKKEQAKESNEQEPVEEKEPEETSVADDEGDEKGSNKKKKGGKGGRKKK